jgi:hypothetical protein
MNACEISRFGRQGALLEGDIPEDTVRAGMPEMPCMCMRFGRDAPVRNRVALGRTRTDRQIVTPTFAPRDCANPVNQPAV